MQLSARRMLSIAAAALFSVSAFAAGADAERIRERLKSPPPHPRLFATAADFVRVRDEASTNLLVRAGVERLLFEAEQMRRWRPSLESREGKRMTAVSQRTLSRILALAFAFRLTGETGYLSRAVEEAEIACGYKSWNPSYFLDTAEMTLAVSIAYDWLYDELSQSKRDVLRRGIVRKGLCESPGRLRTGAWTAASNSWAQVCHAGVLAGAAAVVEDEPDVAAAVFCRAVDALSRAMGAYAPDGGFPENPSVYWPYATSFNLLALDVLERMCGTDFGLSSLPGFRASADFKDSVTGPTGLMFNYGDNGVMTNPRYVLKRTPDVSAWWLARRFNRPDTLVLHELPLYRAHCADRTPLDNAPRRSFQRLLPLALFCVQPPPIGNADPKTPLCRFIDGPVPITVQRTGWGASDWFVGMKGGSPSAPYGHMDGGSFVLDAKGCRWASDLGGEDYYRLESAECDLWNMRQQSDRWRIFRLGTEGHGVLSINGEPQKVDGTARVASFSAEFPSKAVMDLTSLYPLATRVVRTGTMQARGGYVLEDRVEGVEKDANVRWQMITSAKVKSIDGNRLELVQQDADGEEQTLALTVSGEKIAWMASPLDDKPGVDESHNLGMTRVSFTKSADDAGVVSFSINFE